jgi:hypothetical protein
MKRAHGSTISPQVDEAETPSQPSEPVLTSALPSLTCPRPAKKARPVIPPHFLTHTWHFFTVLEYENEVMTHAWEPSGAKEPEEAAHLLLEAFYQSGEHPAASRTVTDEVSEEGSGSYFGEVLSWLWKPTENKRPSSFPDKGADFFGPVTFVDVRAMVFPGPVLRYETLW